MKAFYMEQGSAEWHQIRAGKVTASDVGKVLQYVSKGSAKRGDKRIEESADRFNLRASIVAELLSGMPDMEGYNSPYMQRGTLLEDDARRAYEERVEEMVDRVGFLIHPTIERYGSSPDGLRINGGVEIKAPGKATHLKWLLAGGIPTQHQPQMFCNMDCAEAEYWDFCSYCPEFPDPLKLYIQRLTRDQERIEALQMGVIQFNSEVDQAIERLRELYGPFALPAAQQAQIASKQGGMSNEGLAEWGISDSDIAWAQNGFKQ